jgi:uncharacterized membrane protein
MISVSDSLADGRGGTRRRRWRWQRQRLVELFDAAVVTWREDDTGRLWEPLMACLADVGIDEIFIERARDKITPGTSARRSRQRTETASKQLPLSF